MTEKSRTSTSAAPTLVVGVGASAGGLEAFEQLLASLPSESGMAFLLVQHLDPRHESLLTELLSPRTRMTVVEAEQGAELQLNTIFIIPPNTALAVDDGRIVLSEPIVLHGVRLPVDHLFRSLAQTYGSRSVGIVLSGAGSDGCAGLRSIKTAGGLTIAQDPKSSDQAGMPNAAIDAGVDLVLRIEDIPSTLQRFADMPELARAQLDTLLDVDAPDPSAKPETGPQLDPEAIAMLADMLWNQLHFDLSIYKSRTIERRVIRRMLLSNHDDIHVYLEHLRANLDEQRVLTRDLLIKVTDFFRYPEAFAELRERVVAPMVADAKTGATLRVWVPGCATGEEAYSIAIELLDAIAERDAQLSLLIFATDIDAGALAVGRAGIYPASIVEHVSAERLATYFDPLDDKRYQVRPILRDVVSFAAHDLAKDPPFSRMDLVSCRNVLIYLTPATQRHVLQVLHFALEPGCHLFLSPSESLDPRSNLYATVSKSARIFKKIGSSRPIALPRARARPARSLVDADEPSPPISKPTDLARQAVLAALAPPAIVIASNDAVTFMHGELGPYLRFPQGEDPQLQLRALLRPELALRIRGALYKCRREGRQITALSSPDEGGDTRVRITATPAQLLDDEVVILSFEPEPAAPPTDAPAPDGPLEELEKELHATREDLRSTIEELETSNEELRASNESSMSMNEELQSANEELEASSEELRSLNEELTTVNLQLRDKVEQVERAHDDIANFFSSAQVAIVFLDEQLHIERFTPTAAALLGINRDAVGRSVSAIGHELLDSGLDAEARVVLEHLGSLSRELRDQAGRWFRRQVLPYRTESRRIEGVVISFFDVTELKSTSERLTLRERQQAAMARIGMRALRSTDLQSFMSQTVREVQLTLGSDVCEILELQPGGLTLLQRSKIGRTDTDSPMAIEPDSLFSYALHAGEPVVVHDFGADMRLALPASLRALEPTSALSCIVRSGDHDYGLLCVYTRELNEFGGEDASFLQAVANMIGSAIARYQIRVRLALELCVSQALAEFESLDATLDSVLTCFAASLQVSVAEVWWPEADGRLTCTLRRVMPPSGPAKVDTAFGERRFEPAEGFVGQVFSKGRAAWCTNLSEPSLFARYDEAQTLQLTTGFGIPIRSGSEIRGVVTVLSRERMITDEFFLHSLESIGRALGDFLARAEIERHARRMAAITESSHDAILSYDSDWIITEWLAGAELLFGFTAEEIVGTSMERLVPEERRAELREINTRIQRGEIVDPYETERLCKDGRLIEVSVRSSPIRSRDGTFIGVSSTDRDITRLKQTERQLRAADRQKDEFLAMLGHELRNPLAAIRSASEVLEPHNANNPKLARAQQVLERQSAHMTKLIDGLLDISRIINGKIMLEPEVLDLALLCRDVVASALQRAGPSEVTVDTEIPDEPVWVHGDSVRLAQIVDNLLSNAFKYTNEDGEITLKLAHDDGQAAIVVSDSGVGIASDLLPHVFDVFRQSEQSLDRTQGGLGLGLALVKSLVELHGGGVVAHSEGHGRGSEFTVRLPLADAAPPAPGPRPSAAPDAPLQILVIEDNDDAATMLRLVLEHSGHRVRVATIGRQALVMAEAEPPDVILCDIGLPGELNGFDVAKHLRANPRTRGVELIALSGYSRDEDKQRAKLAGFDLHLTKPVDIATLRRILGEHAARPH